MDFKLRPDGGNPTLAEANWPPVVVGGAFQTGLNLMRDLLSHGVRTVAVDYDLSHQGFASAYGRTYRCPDPDSHGPEWLDFMRNLSAELGQKPLFIPAADVFVIALGRYREELSEHYLNSPEAAKLQAELSSKETQYALCARHGFPCPTLAYIESRQELDLFIAKARFPCLIKPRSPREWELLPPGNAAYKNKVVIAQTAQELGRVYDSIAAYHPEVIAQEVIAGLGDQKRNHISVFGDGGNLLGYCLVKAVRPHPVFTGMTQVVQPFENERLAELCGNLLKAIGYRGICEFEFKLDERNGEPVLIEINPRFSGTGDVAGYTGVQIGWLHYLDSIGYQVRPVNARHFDFSFISIKLEAADTLPYVLDGRIPWKLFLQPYRRRTVYFDFDWHDPWLALITAMHCLRSIAGGVWRHLTGILKPA